MTLCPEQTTIFNEVTAVLSSDFDEVWGYELKILLTILRTASVFLYVLSVGTALWLFVLCSQRDDPIPWLDRIWIGSGVLSLILAFYLEKVEQNRRTITNGEIEKPVESRTAPVASFVAHRSSSNAAYPNAIMRVVRLLPRHYSKISSALSRAISLTVICTI